MRGTVTKIEEQQTKDGKCWMIVFKNVTTQQSFRTWIVERWGNYRRRGWDKVISKGVGVVVDNLVLKSHVLVDADSEIRIIG